MTERANSEEAANTSDKLGNQEYLLQHQYKDAVNFNARVELSRRFRTNRQSWQAWVFEKFQVPPGGEVLELGCGPGYLWRINRQRIPADWKITLSDFSPGMLAEARQSLGDERFTYQVIDAQAIPLKHASQDIVIANHMLYHVPDLRNAIGEIKRVLKPGGRLYATTIGHNNMREMYKLVHEALPELPWYNFSRLAKFTLETGQELLNHSFEHIKIQTYPDALEVTEAEPLVAYLLSGGEGSRLTTAQIATIRARFQREIDAQGSIHITKSTGLFIAPNHG